MIGANFWEGIEVPGDALTLLIVWPLFESECIKENIIVNVQCPENIKLYGWKQDIYTVFVNLFDNSIFGIVEKKCLERKITIIAIKSGKELIIDYIDSGPGINNDLLESGVIFEPQFTTKPNGTGLGLSIVGEAAIRNGLTLTAVQDEKGAHFKVSTE